LEELRRHAQSWATGKADPKPQQPQIKNPQQNIQNPPGTKKQAKLAKAQSLALAAVAAKSGGWTTSQTCYRWLTPAGCPNIGTTCTFQHPPAQKGASHLLPVCQDAVKASGVCPRLAVGIPCFFKHAATACMGVGGATVPSPATSMETSFMVFLQQHAVDREADRQANEARDARMTELLVKLQ